MFHGWNVVAVCMLVFGLANGITAYSYGVLVFPMGAEFGAGRGELMLGMTVSSFVSILCAPLLGNLIDKGQARLLFSGAALLLGLELLLISFASSVWVFVAIFALTTPVVGSLLGPVGTNTVVARWFSRQRARALGILAMGTSIGGLLVPLLLQTLIDNYGWREACRWMALLVPVLLVPCVMLVIRNRPQDMGLNPDGEAAARATADALAAHARASVAYARARLEHFDLTRPSSRGGRAMAAPARRSRRRRRHGSAARRCRAEGRADAADWRPPPVDTAHRGV